MRSSRAMGRRCRGWICTDGNGFFFATSSERIDKQLRDDRYTSNVKNTLFFPPAFDRSNAHANVHIARTTVSDKSSSISIHTFYITHFIHGAVNSFDVWYSLQVSRIIIITYAGSRVLDIFITEHYFYGRHR